MIAACSHLGDTTTALGVLSAMGDAGVAPTERTLGALLNTYAKAGNVDSAYMIFDAIQVGLGVGLCFVGCLGLVPSFGLTAAAPSVL